MAQSPEQSGGEKKGRLLTFYKNFNKVSAAAFVAAGVIFEAPVLFGFAAIDIAQSAIVSAIEKRRDRQKSSAAKVGEVALRGT